MTIVIINKNEINKIMRRITIKYQGREYISDKEIIIIKLQNIIHTEINEEYDIIINELKSFIIEFIKKNNLNCPLLGFLYLISEFELLKKR